MHKKYLTVEQAQERIPTLRRLLQKLVRFENSLNVMESIDIEFDEDHEEIIHQTATYKAYHKLWYEYYKALEKVHAIGAVIKDTDTGVVDFYSIYDGREILLCWHFDEENIRYWHEIEDGYDGRKPISLLKKAR